MCLVRMGVPKEQNDYKKLGTITKIPIKNTEEKHLRMFTISF